MDFALNHHQWLIYHKVKPNQTTVCVEVSKFYIYMCNNESYSFLQM